MNFVKGRDELKNLRKLEACFGWFFITFVFGFLVSCLFLEYKSKLNDSWHLWGVPALPLVVGVCFYILTLIFNCNFKNIKSIKIKDFEAVSSKANSNSEADSSLKDNYKIFYYGIEPYVRNKFNINLNSKYDFNSIKRKIHNSEEYHKCELMVYETLANRRFWNIFCPFIGTEVLTMEEIEDIIEAAKLNK